jgi:hypothetical protein
MLRFRILGLNLSLAFLGVGLGLGGVESGARLTAPEWLEYRMKQLRAGGEVSNEIASDRGWKVRMDGDVMVSFEPGSSFWAVHPEWSNEIHIDKWGGRASGTRDSDSTLVPVLGDSFVFGLGVDDQETFVSLLNPRSTHRFLNLGVPGTGLTNQLDIIERRDSELGSPPVYVFGLFLGNDLSDIENAAKSAATKAERSALGNPQQPTLAPPSGAMTRLFERTNRVVYFNPFLKRSYAIQWIRAGLLSLFNRSQDNLMMDPALIAMTTADSAAMHEAFVAQIDRLERLQAKLGFRSVFVLIPDRYQVDSGLRDAKARTYGRSADEFDPLRANRFVSGVLADHRVRYLDVTSSLGGHGDDYYVQDNHLRPTGQRTIAEMMSPALDILVSEAAAEASLPR